MSNEPTIRFYGRIVGGVPKYYRPLHHKSVIDKLEGKEFEETLSAKYEDESSEQHGYYRGGIIRATCMQTEAFEGWTEKEIHQEFANRFLKFVKNKIIKAPNGTEINEEITVVESTGDLGKKRMSEFIDNVLNFLATLEIFPLSPEEYQVNKYQSYVRSEKS